MSDLPRLVRQVRAVLRPEDILPRYRRADRPMAGACYVASEAVYHLAGGKGSGLRPRHLPHEGSVHWWLVTADGEIVDPTVDQFDTPVPYERGNAGGFLTKEPSKRARRIMDRVRAT